MAIELLGDGSYIEFVAPLVGDRATFTIEFWIKPSWPPINGANNPWRNAIYIETNLVDGERNFVQILSEDPTVAGHSLGSVSCEYWPPTGPPGVFSQPVSEQVWQHVAVVSDQSLLRIYIDGVLHDEGPAQGLLSSFREPTIFRIGSVGNVFGRYVIDELRISTTARYSADFTPPRVHALEADTLSLWRFDETPGRTTSDAAGNELDGILSPTVIRVLSDR